MNFVNSRGGFGILLLALWCVFTGISALFGLTFAGAGVILALLLLVAGGLLLAGR